MAPPVWRTTMNRLNAGDHVTSLQDGTPDVVCNVQLIPSDDVEISLLRPTAHANPSSGDQTTPLIESVPNPLVLDVHVTPSGEVESRPDDPPQMNKPMSSAQHTHRIDVVPNPLVRCVHVIPSGEVASLPLSPTATHKPSDGE